METCTETPEILILSIAAFIIWIILKILVVLVQDCLRPPRDRRDEENVYEPVVVRETKPAPVLMKPLLSEKWEPTESAETITTTTTPLPTTATSEPIWIPGRGPPLSRVFDWPCNVCNAPPPPRQQEPQVVPQQEEEEGEEEEKVVVADEADVSESHNFNCHLLQQYASVPVLRRTPFIDIIEDTMSLP
ncbi:uncharacterized protein [Panulirus ornatus]|uniref:uncharacterized protein isoform X2 n=1 Tax=Panulirus ornatus TaxID=150431 RepID=UPI003A8832C2